MTVNFFSLTARRRCMLGHIQIKQDILRPQSFSSSSITLSKSSANPDEIAHFNALASTWWDYNGPSRLLHLMNPLRHDFITRCHRSQDTIGINATSSLHKLRYLDVGCGGGIFAESAARLSNVESVMAIDPCPKVLSVAKAHARQDPLLSRKLQYLNTTIEDIPAPISAAEQYDVLSLFEVVEHITYPAAFIEECFKFVKPGGWMVMSTIARTWLSWLTTIAIAENVLGIVPRGTHDWANYINAEELKSWFMEKGGWNNPIVMGVVYVPGIGWKPVSGSESVGNYFLGIRKNI